MTTDCEYCKTNYMVPCAFEMRTNYTNLYADPRPAGLFCKWQYLPRAGVACRLVQFAFDHHQPLLTRTQGTHETTMDDGTFSATTPTTPSPNCFDIIYVFRRHLSALSTTCSSPYQLSNSCSISTIVSLPLSAQGRRALHCE